jgi:hypothetical protein
MMRIYDVAQSERGTELMKAILDAAYTRNAALSVAAAQKIERRHGCDPRPQAMTPSGRAQSVRAELLAAIRRARTAR